MDALERYLNSFGKSVVNKSKGILKRKKKVVSSELLNSISYKLQKNTNGYTVQFFMADYGTFIDKGVSGTNQKRTYVTYEGKREKSPYAYTTKRPPMSVLDKWIVRRGIAPRDEKGRFVSRKSLQYLIARKIFTQGIEGISFFQKPLQLGMNDFYDQVGNAIKEDIINTI
jgi:hypothetical protein